MTADPGDPAGPDVSVVIVTFNSRDLVGAAIESAAGAARGAGLSAETIVVDNRSTDGTADHVAAEHPEVVLIRNDRNDGYGAGNNVAFRQARGRWWLLLNPDARVDAPALRLLVDALAGHPRIAAVGPSITGAGTGEAESAGELPGLRSLTAHFLFLNRLLPGDRGGAWRGWQLRAGRVPGLRSAGWLSGAVLLARPEAMRAVGGFDESIFLYGEDVELGYQLQRRGWRLAVEGRATATHAIGGSQTPASARWIGGIDAYLVRRGRAGLARRACMLVIAAGLGIRAVASAVGRGGDPSHRIRLRAGAAEAARRALGPTRPA
jgi:N-acetylglucosaminyl-diphospho-decaprenol L-rhamnosyltransferase